MLRSRLSLVVLAGLVLAPALASADVPPPPSIASCQGATAGAACELDAGGAGQCAPWKCSRLDYSQGSPPSSVEYDCFRCAAASEAKAPEKPADTKSAPPAAEAKGCAVDPTGGMLGVLFALVGVRRRRRAHSRG
ncbi:MYXO-CTERM sorting domain-containing protein [Nannocystis sp. ILAH1]|uniref:MYXO-CTERM sorting domain-containing protein n=1 Tax=unclassified Nannocystis TaxID=2627009 RepID=UPI0022717CC6|nr:MULTISPECIES: MYXO-CTERM sorting domain-containing protein [unclassified Nannocystis]MCY0990664.1 MYXO-CTERM sorting domain-containing protein [Nannocystis sp. ILAH1]MCY1072197.1 MYXO-CTERM sorting domain-containing protein [Nannocystis sp. RBIL2]